MYDVIHCCIVARGSSQLNVSRQLYTMVFWVFAIFFLLSAVNSAIHFDYTYTCILSIHNLLRLEHSLDIPRQLAATNWEVSTYCHWKDDTDREMKTKRWQTKDCNCSEINYPEWFYLNACTLLRRFISYNYRCLHDNVTIHTTFLLCWHLFLAHIFPDFKGNKKSILKLHTEYFQKIRNFVKSRIFWNPKQFIKKVIKNPQSFFRVLFFIITVFKFTIIPWHF